MTYQVEYTANGYAAVFPFPFAIETDAEVEVLLSGVLQSGDYSVRGQGSIDGGAVVFDSAPANGLVITLRRRGAIAVTVADAGAGYLSDKLVAGGNVTLETLTETDGVQRLRISATDAVDALKKAANLSDLSDKVAARANLGVYSKAEVEGLDQTVRDAALLKNDNLFGLADPVEARKNLGVYSKAEVVALDQAVKDAALLKDDNLLSLSDPARARENLDVYSRAEVAALDQSVKDAALLKDDNLLSLSDPAQARENLDVYSRAEVADRDQAAKDAALLKDDNLLSLGDPAQARINLGVYSKNEVNTEFGKVLYRNVSAVVEAGFWSKPVALSVIGGIATPDPLAGSVFTLSMTASTTLDFPSGMAGKAGMFLVVAKQDVTGGHALTLAPGYALVGGEWSTQANAVNLLWVTSDGSGTVLDIVIAQRGV